MTHEPECPWRFEDDCHVVAAGVTFCEVIRSGYQRGRNNAAKNVEAVAEPFFLSRFNPIDEDAWEVFVNMLAAARGDWHMKSIKYYYNVHMPECEDEHCGGCIPANPEDLEGI